MLDLNNVSEIENKDPDGYLKILAETPALCKNVLDDFLKIQLPRRKFEKVVICAMGGSAIGADLAKSLLEQKTNLMIQVIRDYNLPNWVDNKTLVIAISYSGNTEETLTAFYQAKKRNSQIYVIASGGKLIEQAKNNLFDYYLLPTGLPPRTAWGLSFILVNELLRKYGLLPDDQLDSEKMIKEMSLALKNYDHHLSIEENPAKKIALGLTETVPIIFGAEHLGVVARRWKGQFNENAKIPSFYEELPELNHNSQQGLECIEPIKQRLSYIILDSNNYHPRNQLRAKVVNESWSNNGFDTTLVQVGGDSAFEETIRVVILGDYVSVYLALLLEKNPVKFEAIEELKRHLKTEEYTNELLK
mgnify:CR=1 FL=1